MPLRRTVLATALLLAGTAIAGAAPNVVASIKPVHSLVAAVMDGVGTPDLIVEGAGSPHNYALRPSQAREIERAGVIFWVGHDLEPFLEKPLETLGASARVVELAETPGLTLLAPREGGAFEKHEHQDEEHAHEEGEDDDHAHEEDGHDEEHERGETDLHLWLDPRNVAAMLTAIAEALAEADPQNAATYTANAEKTATRLAEQEETLNARLEPARGKPFIVFHDAYHYFENRFGLAAAGSITISPEVAPGAERIAEIRARLDETDAVCVFSEPQFKPRVISVVTEGSEARSGVLDPLGATLEPGPDLYFQLLDGMAQSFLDCLTK